MNTRAHATPSPRLADILTPEANSFGVLRFAMATLVLISHSYLYCAGTSEAEPLVGWLGRSLGECAVQVFFILSGVMVAQSFDRQPQRRSTFSCVARHSQSRYSEFFRP